MDKKTNNLGQVGEDAAARYLENKGYEILDRNFQNNLGRRLGEIDIVAYDEKLKELVFVEVKTRAAGKYADTLPEENITYSKLRKLSRIASAYLRLKRLEDSPYRFDAVSVWWNAEEKKAEIKHIEGL